MWAAEVETRRQGTQYARTGRYQEWEPGEQEEVERDQLEAELAERVGPGFPGLAGFYLAQRGFLYNINLLVGHHPAVAQRVARSARA